MFLPPLLLPTLVCTCPPLFGHSHSPNPTHLLPLSTPIHPPPFHSSCSPALSFPCSHKPTPLFAFAYPCLHLPIRVIHIHTPTCTCPPTCSFMLVYTCSSTLVPICAYSPHLFRTCSHLCLAFICVHSHSFVPAQLTGPHLCLYQIYC